MKTFELPDAFSFSVEQAAEIAGCHPKTIRAHIDRYVKDPSDRYGIKARRNTPGGKQLITHKDLRDYLERTVIGAEIVTKEVA